jgi:hypothetical protein
VLDFCFTACSPKMMQDGQKLVELMLLQYTEKERGNVKSNN